MNVERFRECRCGLATEVAFEDFRTLRIGQTSLFLLDRWDGSMGRSVTLLTRENAAETGHVVGVGIPSHHLHWLAGSTSDDPPLVGRRHSRLIARTQGRPRPVFLTVGATGRVPSSA
jgi:hypothetical protein